MLEKTLFLGLIYVSTAIKLGIELRRSYSGE